MNDSAVFYALKIYKGNIKKSILLEDEKPSIYPTSFGILPWLFLPIYCISKER